MFYSLFRFPGNIQPRNLHARNLILAICLLGAIPAFAGEIKNSDVEMEVHMAPEDREVGLKRMELIDKMLSKDLIDRKRALVKEVEADYNKKITKLLQGMISPVINQTVLTHIDVNFFASDFESEVHSSQKVAVSILIKKNGFDVWGNKFASQQEALDTIKQIISTTFNIQPEKISIFLV